MVLEGGEVPCIGLGGMGGIGFGCKEACGYSWFHIVKKSCCWFWLGLAGAGICGCTGMGTGGIGNGGGRLKGFCGGKGGL